MNATSSLSDPIPAMLARAGLSIDALANGDLLCPRPARADLQGQWIWVPERLGYAARNSYACFRRTFTASGPLTVHIAADTSYELHLDGVLIDRGTMAAETSYKTFDTHELSVPAGQHVLAVLVHHFGQQCATAMRSRPGLFVELTAADGSRVVTDASWKVLPATAYHQWLPCMMSHFGFYEVCDHDKLPATWTARDFDDGAWPAAEIVGPVGCAPWRRLIPRDIPKLATTTVPASAVLGGGSYQPGPIPEVERDLTVAVEMAARRREPRPVAGAFPLHLAGGGKSEFAVVDFGREVTGHVQLTLAGAKAGQKIDLGYDEILDGNGLPAVRRTYVHAADRAYLRAGQTELRIFGGRGFRYLMIDVAAGLGGLTITGASVAERTYPVACTGSFRSSDPALEQLYQIGLTTTRLCMLDSYVDCPGRERVMWMDMAVEAQCSVYGFGDTALWRHCLFLFAQNPAREGAVAGAIKGFAPCDYDPMLVSYTLYYLMSVADYHLHSGDTQACAALFPSLLKQLEVVAQFTTKTGLINEKWPGWGTFLDWSAMDIGGVSSCNNAIHIRALRLTARLARALGAGGLAERFEQQVDRLSVAYHEVFWSPAEELFVDSLYEGKPSAVRSQLASVMAIWAGLVTGDAARALLGRIMREDRLLPRTASNYRLKPGFQCQTGGLVRIGTPGSGYLLVEILFELGMAREALAYLKDNWLPIAPTGTFAEHFLLDREISYCHGWGAGAVAQLPAYVLGVRPLAPGWSEIEIVPQVGDLAWAEGTIPTPAGEIFVRWEKTAGEPRLEYRVPPAIKVVRAHCQ